MEIYLVRVRERPDNTLWVERKPTATTKDSYIAISHVWGDPETINPTHVDGVGMVPLSPGKKDILSMLRREDICGSSWFWMDLFCIDQSPNAAISISDQLVAIPTIYKSSQCVKVLIEAPVCSSWQATASNAARNQDVDPDIFKEEELRHSRRCPKMLFRDPWFVRLWTRQEGLYAITIHITLLNPVDCARFSKPVSAAQKWVTEGNSMQTRSAVEGFIEDKLGYHGLSREQEELRFRFYLDLVYRHRVEVKEYRGVVGPHAGYSPIGEAWRSGRKTTKVRDYVLAVFPDVKGYRPPPDARHLTFRALIEDAFTQISTFRPSLCVIPKVSRGLMSTMTTTPSRSTDSALPWIPEDPSNITEAFDSFRIPDHTDIGGRDAKFYLVAHPISFELIHFNRESLPDLVKLWESTANTIRHAVFAAPSGPCIGISRDVQSKEGLLYQYFIHQFMPSAVARYSTEAEFQAMAPTGIVDLDNIHIDANTFSNQLQRFLVCLLSGTTMHTTETILSFTEARLVTTPYGKLFSLVNKIALSSTKPEDFVLVTTMSSAHEGLQIAVKVPGQSSYSIVGRTFIPSTQFWDFVLEGQQNKQ